MECANLFIHGQNYINIHNFFSKSIISLPEYEKLLK